MTPSPAKMEAHAFQKVWTGTTASAHWPSEGKSTVVRMPGIPKIDYLKGGRAWGSPSCPPASCWVENNPQIFKPPSFSIAHCSVLQHSLRHPMVDPDSSTLAELSSSSCCLMSEHVCGLFHVFYKRGVRSSSFFWFFGEVSISLSSWRRGMGRWEDRGTDS